MRIDYAVIGLSIILLVGSIYLAGLSLQMTDTPSRIQTVNYATELFASGIALLIFMETVAFVKRALLRTA